MVYCSTSNASSLNEPGFPGCFRQSKPRRQHTFRLQHRGCASSRCVADCRRQRDIDARATTDLQYLTSGQRNRGSERVDGGIEVVEADSPVGSGSTAN